MGGFDREISRLICGRGKNPRKVGWLGGGREGGDKVGAYCRFNASKNGVSVPHSSFSIIYLL